MTDLNANDLEAAAKVDRGHRPQHGHRGRRLAIDPIARHTPAAHPARGRPSARPSERNATWHTARSTSRRRSSSTASTLYTPDEAAELAKQTTTVNFDATVEAHLRLGVDPRHADQMVRGTVVLPHGTGKVVRVAVFAQGDKAQEALRAGADEVGAEDLVKKIEAGWLEFDVALATPDTMGLVGRLGKILGRRGLMPNPKSGTITFDLERAVREVKGGRVEFKVDKAAIVHVAVGKASFEPEALVGNLAALVDAVNRAKPAGRQGPVPQGPDDREHDGPRHPGRHPGSPRGRGSPRAATVRRALRPAPYAATVAQRGASPEPKTRRTAKTACARGPRARRG